jgi:hypothetical protein
MPTIGNATSAGANGVFCRTTLADLGGRRLDEDSLFIMVVRAAGGSK